ncbi:MAG: peptidoglycan DD-metalloendopeptidase family protein [Simplicispira suum]|uniref:peptidoglycan DD-metalloendopeptidase family protein n=1 Tax=Simplicispira suum TaxID=2109915 RepID=UPI001C6B1BD5|nr:peptidoglycan DD-metalloendopeptidase family protein [Simplicispira suum]MBW7831649.1 peptidoglycan DD-metalloendopeptidase family protein [Simplicispira suum]
MQVSRVRVLGISLLLAGLALGGCSTRMTRAPVVDRGTAVAGSTSSSEPMPATVVKAPQTENAGGAGTYTVKPGDTLIRIGLDTGQSWKDIARWNQIDNPNLIEVGQVLRVAPPQTAAVAQAAPGVVTRPVPAPSVAPVVVGAAPAGSSTPSDAPAATEGAQVASHAAPATAEDGTAFIWPASGSLLAGFDEARNKGLDIAGKSGDAIVAAADGRVVYAGAGLRGYGNLIILKHSNVFLTAYAHNRALLVKEDQTVRRGQKIAEMGNTDSDRVKLHFEIRRQGKPVDPARYLPAR